jgi:hypothetical protein
LGEARRDLPGKPLAFAGALRDTSRVTSEKRQQPRAPCAIAAAVDGPRGPMRGTCTDLSLGGAFIQGVMLSVGAPTRVTLTLSPGPTLMLEAQVTRQSLTPRGVGVSFMRLDPQKVARLQQLVGGAGAPG